jgi:hypothetical protein
MGGRSSTGTAATPPPPDPLRVGGSRRSKEAPDRKSGTSLTCFFWSGRADLIPYGSWHVKAW